MSSGAREIRTLSEAEAIQHMVKLNATDDGYVLVPSPGQYLGRDSTWVEIEVPHDLYEAEWNSPDAGLSRAQRERAERYAFAIPGLLPPGMASFEGDQGQRKLRVSDGNHRAYASFLRGSPTACFYIPQKDWRRFQDTLSNEVPR